MPLRIWAQFGALMLFAWLAGCRQTQSQAPAAVENPFARGGGLEFFNSPTAPPPEPGLQGDAAEDSYFPDESPSSPPVDDKWRGSDATPAPQPKSQSSAVRPSATDGWHDPNTQSSSSYVRQASHEEVVDINEQVRIEEPAADSPARSVVFSDNSQSTSSASQDDIRWVTPQKGPSQDDWYGASQDFSRLRGKLEYSPEDDRWRLRYTPPDASADKYDGTVVLERSPLLNGVIGGDFIVVEGSLNEQGRYRIRRLGRRYQ